MDKIGDIKLLFTWKRSDDTTDTTFPRGDVTIFREQEIVRDAWNSAIITNATDFFRITREVFIVFQRHLYARQTVEIEKTFTNVFNFQGDRDFIHFRADKELEQLLESKGII